MSNLTVTGKQDLTIIVWKGERVITTGQLAEEYETTTDNIKMNFSRNASNFETNKHFYFLQGAELKEFKSLVTDSYLVDKHTSQLYLWTRRGASRHCKILDTEKAWEQFDYLEENYFNPQPTIATEQLSPELQMFNKIFEAMARQEMQQKEQGAKLEQIDNRIESIKEVVALSSNGWRQDSAAIIDKIALNLGGYEHISTIRREVYGLLDQRMGVKLNTRLTNMKKTAALNGASKSKVDKMNPLDVIAADKKLIEGYVAIVKEMAIKYGVSAGEQSA